MAEAATSIIFVATNRCSVATKHVFCSDKCMLVATKRLSDKHKYLSRQFFFIATKRLSPQAYFCRDKRRVLSRQTRVYLSR